MVDRKDSNTQLLQELESLSQSLYPSQPNRRTASLALPRSASPTPGHVLPSNNDPQSGHRPRSRRMSMSPWRSRPKQPQDSDSDVEGNESGRRHHPPSKSEQPTPASTATAEKKSIWSWKPMRALSHIRMQRLACLFSVEVVAVQALPPSMNGLRLSVSVRKKETKDGAVQTMPARVLRGAADFEETLFIRCHVYCSGGSGTGKPLKFEPRPFLISVIAIDAPELDLGRSTVDLSELVKDSMEKSLEGSRVRQWDSTHGLSGKAKGGELVLKLGFQIMEDGGVGIYNQAEPATSSKKASSLIARRHSKSSFSVTSPRISRPDPSSLTPSKQNPSMDLKGIDDFSLDEPGPPPVSSSPGTQKSEQEPKVEDLDLPEFDIVDKGIEVQEEEEKEKEKEEEEQVADPQEAARDESSISGEVVKEVVHHDSAHLVRLTELDEIAKQIKALESMIGDGYGAAKVVEGGGEEEMQRLDAEEESVRQEFLQMLEMEHGRDANGMQELLSLAKPVTEAGADSGPGGDSKAFLSELGQGLGSVVQTRDGGFLAAMNPLDVQVSRKDAPKLAMQISKPLILSDQKQASGFEVFQKLASMGPEELGSKLVSLASMDELMGKTAEQIAFEGMASAIISGRNKEGASSSAARSVAVLKTMASAMIEGRKEGIVTGIWNAKEDPVVVEEILAFSLQKIEAMAVEGLKIQADMADEEAPFDVSPLAGKESAECSLESVFSPEDWTNTDAKANSVTLLVVVQLRDPLRRYEVVGAPAIALVQAVRVEGDGRDEEERFKVISLHVGGLKLRSGGRRSAWDSEKQRLTATQWLVAYGLVKAGKKSKPAQPKGGQDLLWSLSSRVMAGMWLKPIRNPNVKLLKK